METFDSRAYRDTMGQFCTGVVIVTGAQAGELVGFAAQSFVSLSLAAAAGCRLPRQGQHQLAAHPRLPGTSASTCWPTTSKT